MIQPTKNTAKVEHIPTESKTSAEGMIDGDFVISAARLRSWAHRTHTQTVLNGPPPVRREHKLTKVNGRQVEAANN